MIKLIKYLEPTENSAVKKTFFNKLYLLKTNLAISSHIILGRKYAKVSANVQTDQEQQEI